MSGLFSAAFLRQIGWDVDVYERSSVELVGRGAGITGHPELLEALEASGAGTEMLGIEVPKRIAIDREGRITDERPLRQILTSWDRLQRLLRATIDEAHYHLGWNFERVEQDERGVRVQFSGGRVEHAGRRLKDWLAQQARADLDERVSWHARKLGVRPRRIGLRDQTSRWGSCSSSGLLSFSWRLIFAPPLVLDYVAAHEVAHLVEMNHGARFWKLVAECVPSLDEAKQWLRHEGTDLHRYGVEWTVADRD